MDEVNMLVEAALLCLGETEPAWEFRVGELEVVIIAHDGRKLRVRRVEAEAMAMLMGKIDRRVIRLLREHGMIARLASCTEEQLRAVPGIGKATARRIARAMRGDEDW